RGRGCADHEIDVISGLAGIGAYLLSRADEPSLRPILEQLVRLLAAEGAVPAWHTPPELLDDDSREEYPSGRLNCGLAHGLPGPLALLALAGGAGVRVGGIEDAIRRASTWLVEHAVEDEWGVNWSYGIPLAAGAAGGSAARAAWCYG